MVNICHVNIQLLHSSRWMVRFYAIKHVVMLDIIRMLVLRARQLGYLANSAGSTLALGLGIKY